ncbi:succinate dehydrogenase assembly factor 2 [Catenovulum agarivorans]|uniref:FAD assembly factor SdhE n=1 Tax=Catenovulum agarivorans TaxID=1172192 RepID=UPI0003122307|nr:succinate dehydrogenase assembly factor 2 [Catenovulum agarivorans]
MQSAARTRWACRRGMLELDVILMPFMDNHYDNLPEAEQLIFQRLLEGIDPELYAWFMGHEKCEDTELAEMIKKIHKLNGAPVSL